MSELAEQFYGAPPAPAPEPEAGATQPEAGLFFDRYKAFGSDLSQQAETLYDQLGLTATEREAQDRAFVTLADELELEANDMIALHRSLVQSVLDVLPSGSTPQPAAGETPAAPDQDGQVEAKGLAADYAVAMQVRQTLRSRLGEQEAEDVIQRTQALIERTPGLKEMRDNGLLTMRAEPFLLLAEHVRKKHIR